MPVATSKSYWCLVVPWFGLDQELACKPDGFRVIDRHVQEGGEVSCSRLRFVLRKGFVALASAPEDIVFLRRVEVDGSMAFLTWAAARRQRRWRRDWSMTAHVAGIAEEIGGVPHSSFTRTPSEVPRHAPPAYPGSCGIREAWCLPERYPGHESTRMARGFFQRTQTRIHPLLRDGHGIGSILPWPYYGAGPKGIGACAAKSMPVGHGKARCSDRDLPSMISAGS